MLRDTLTAYSTLIILQLEMVGLTGGILRSSASQEPSLCPEIARPERTVSLLRLVRVRPPAVNDWVWHSTASG